ncbi:MAG: S-layer homology domain-containing protein [Tumebacillaceae bacterium]
MKRMKTMTAAALTIGMLFAGIPYAVYADVSTTPTAPTTQGNETSPAISQEQAVANAKKITGLSDAFKLASAKFYKDGYLDASFEGKLWDLTFENGKTGDDKKTVQITIDAMDGTLVLYMQFGHEAGSGANPLSQEAAKAKAEQYLHQLAPDKASFVTFDHTYDQSNVDDEPNDGNLHINYVRTFNGIPFEFDYIEIDVSPSGELQSYHQQWTKDLQFPANASPTITQAQATAAFRNTYPLTLEYANGNQYLPDNKYYLLQYGLLKSFQGVEDVPLIDAHSGGAINWEGNPYPATSAAGLQPLAEQPGAPVTMQPITEQAARDVVSKFNLGLDGYTFDSSVRQLGYGLADDQNYWGLEFSKQDADKKSYVGVDVDVRTGDLLKVMRIDLHEPNTGTATTSTLTKEQAQQKAIDFMKQALPSKLNQIALDTSWNPVNSKNLGQYQFRFLTLLNGVPVQGDYRTVTIDGNTGMILNFDGDQGISQHARLSGKTPVVSLATAKDKIMEKFPVRLQYFPIFDDFTSSQTGSERVFPKVKGVVLAYAPDMGIIEERVDAVTGELTDKNVEAPPLEITDIQGHWAEKQLKLYAESGIFELKEGKVMPNETLTRAEVVTDWVKVVDQMNDPHRTVHFSDVPKENPYYPVVEDAYESKLLDPSIGAFRPNDNMTRGELADLVARTIGKGKIAPVTGAAKAHFSDVSSTSNYYAAINAVVSAGIMSGSYGAFAPNQPVTKAQLAVVMAKTEAYRK